MSGKQIIPIESTDFNSIKSRPLSSDGMRPRKVFAEANHSAERKQSARNRYAGETFVRDIDEPMICKVTGYYVMREGITYYVFSVSTTVS
jgi:hypothetical protein